MAEPRIAHFSTLHRGGAAAAAYRLHVALLKEGCDSTMFVVEPVKNLMNVQQVVSHPSGTEVDYWRRILREWQIVSVNHPLSSPMKVHYSSPITEISLAELVEGFNVLNLHWVAGMVDTRELKSLGDKAKLLWTLHDANPFTGGCHYPQACLRYADYCHHCPQLGPSSLINMLYENIDQTFEQWTLKSQSYSELEMTIVCPSKWIAQCSKESSLLGKKTHKIIPYGIDLQTFLPYQQSKARCILGIQTDCQYIAFGADAITDHRKGADLCENIIRHVAKNYFRNFKVLVFGGYDNPFPEMPVEVIPLGFLDEDRLAIVYSASDLYLMPSREDNLPNTCIESLACGTPVAGFDIGGMSEIVCDQYTGVLALYPDVSSLADKINEIMKRDNPIEMRIRCREEAEKKYGSKNQAHEYISLYHKLLEDTQVSEK